MSFEMIHFGGRNCFLFFSFMPIEYLHLIALRMTTHFWYVIGCHTYFMSVLILKCFRMKRSGFQGVKPGNLGRKTAGKFSSAASQQRSGER